MTADNCVQDVSFPECKSADVGKLSLQLNCNSDCVYILRAIVAVMAARAGLDKMRSNRVSIAVDELFANILAHAYGGKAGRVEFETCIDHSAQNGCELSFSFRDYAALGWLGSIEEAAACVTDVDDLCPGGLGLKLIYSVSDRCEHEVLSDGNRWRLIFHLNDEEHDSEGSDEHACAAYSHDEQGKGEF
ncbi:MAG: ATP-binding protein [Mariprofundus sp.]|nr:ATP-binding protein [Mariprofundus sp.]